MIFSNVTLRQTMLLIFAGALLFSAAPARAVDFFVAGAPRPLVKDRDYFKLLSTLQSNRIAGFFPTFQYQEIPQPKGFDYESDFVPPCSQDSSAFQALRTSGVKLIVPAELIYPNPANLSPKNLGDDALKKLVACAGRENIYGVTNYDEAAFHGIAEANVQRLYAQVKAVDPTLPVLMVHGPIVMDKPEFSSESKRNRYLANVVKYSRHADIVGFDVYPVPNMIAQLATPLSSGEIVTADETATGYLRWMKTNLPNKRKLMVYQGFGYADMYESDFLKNNIPKELSDLARAPIRSELEQMVKSAEEFGVEAIIWWGQGALKKTNQAPWPDIMSLAKKAAN